MISKQTLPKTYPLIDTHTHFDAPVFDSDRELLVQQAYKRGVRHLVLVGYSYQYFERMYNTEQLLNKLLVPLATEERDSSNLSQIETHTAIGLHPFYIKEHSEDHLKNMAHMIAEQRPIAIGEIGLDTFTESMREPEVFDKQKQFFKAQLDIAVLHKLPVMLHIRKAHAEALAILKAHDYDAHQLGGIAHSFSGGEQEAKAFVRLGFKLGVTGQITNPNAKKLRRAIHAAVETYGIECLVIETDCPDMTPIQCQMSDNSCADKQSHDRNVPANLPWVLSSLSELLNVSPDRLAEQLWHNSCSALHKTWAYPLV
ncbi:TatD family hydrolase [Psychrobacter sp. SCQQ22]|uniref:TatD family hydrolase n=1 Tax=Psychrobacter sp. SCQQ22 TaxID=2792059 RepID=UPI0018CE284A|nr:TatD family hydrolase [Psychrobacter sp. SCQQ22]MBH0085635.1 TatD family hydrolase [Psychrobacter sp. SCQQ22]